MTWYIDPAVPWARPTCAPRSIDPQAGAAASRSTATAATLVTLNAGQSANALVRIVEAGNYPTGTCKPTATTFLQIFPPGQTTPIYLAYKSTGCASAAVNLLSVSVMTAGTGG